MSNDLVFQFKCLSGVTDLNVHDFVSFFISRAVPCISRSLCSIRTRPIVSPTFYEFFCCILYFSIFMVYCIIVLVLYESYPIRLLKKINRRSVPPLSRALLGQPNSLKPGEVIALQITRSLSDNKVSVFINKSALH